MLEPRISTRRLLSLALASLALVGCTRDQRAAKHEPPAPTAAPAPSAAPATMSAPAQPAPGGDGISGTVTETMDAGGYTYARVDRGGSQVWVAGPATKLAVGAQIGPTSGTLMTGFRSDTLDRTFDQIYFVGAFPIAGEGGAAAPAAPAAPATAPSAPSSLPVAPVAGGKTIAEVFAGKAVLAGKPVAVRGKVVKVNNGIMGRNWLHLQDGTGAAGTNDLLITTSAIATLGDTVVARGTLAADKDFGGGYRYDLVVEDATIAPN